MDVESSNRAVSSSGQVNLLQSETSIKADSQTAVPLTASGTEAHGVGGIVINKNLRLRIPFEKSAEQHGDIAEVMEVFGIKRVARYSLRALAAKALTVEWAARIHGVPLDKFLEILNQATHPNAAQPE